MAVRLDVKLWPRATRTRFRYSKWESDTVLARLRSVRVATFAGFEGTEQAGAVTATAGDSSISKTPMVISSKAARRLLRQATLCLTKYPEGEQHYDDTQQ